MIVTSIPDLKISINLSIISTIITYIVLWVNGGRGGNRGMGEGGREDRSSCLLEERTCRVGQLTLFYTDNIMYIFIYIIFFFFPSLYILCTRSNAVGNQMCPTTFALQRYVLTMVYESKIVGNARAHLERRPIAGIV